MSLVALKYSSVVDNSTFPHLHLSYHCRFVFLLYTALLQLYSTSHQAVLTHGLLHWEANDALPTSQNKNTIFLCLYAKLDVLFYKPQTALP
jgi:hypothetical protein